MGRAVTLALWRAISKPPVELVVADSHKVSDLMYHFVFPAKYRRVVFDDQVDVAIKETCEEISKRYEIYFLEIGTDLFERQPFSR